MKNTFVLILILLMASKTFSTLLQLSKVRSSNGPENASERQLYSPIFDNIAYQNYVEYMAKYGGNPLSFTPYAPLYQNPFSNPSFAANFPASLSHWNYGKNLLNYMAFNNPLLYIPTGYGNPWNMGEFGLGTRKSGHSINKVVNPHKKIQMMMGNNVIIPSKNKKL